MGTIASQITSLTILNSTVYSGADQRKHQSSASLAFVRGIHRWPLNAENVSIRWHHHEYHGVFSRVQFVSMGNGFVPNGLQTIACSYTKITQCTVAYMRHRDSVFKKPVLTNSEHIKERKGNQSKSVCQNHTVTSGNNQDTSTTEIFFLQLRIDHLLK